MIEIFTEELCDVERNLEVLEQSTMRYRSGKMQEGLEKRKQNLSAKLQELRMKINERKDETIDFHSMGIDHIFVDECHYQNFYEFPKFRIKLLILILLHFNIVRIIY